MSGSISNKITTDKMIYYVNAIDTRCYNGGNTITDLSENKYNGSLINGTSYSSGSFVFDGINDYIDTGVDFSFSSGDKFTIAALFNTTNSFLFNQGIFGKPNTTFGTDIDCTGFEWRFFLRNNQLRFAYWNSGGSAILSINSSELIIPNKWYYCVVVYANNAAYLYLNGVLVGSDLSVFGTFMNRTNNAMIGFTYGDNCTSGYFNGRIPLVQIYNKDLSYSEILQNYSAINRRLI
jgi:hypothetical protein